MDLFDTIPNKHWQQEAYTKENNDNSDSGCRDDYLSR